MTQADEAGNPGPYAQAFEAYLAAGWRGVLPLPARRKTPPPDGYTGRVLTWPSVPDVYTWAEQREGRGNVALRLPQHVVGIDVDAYDNKPGAQTLTDHEQRLGALPPTWRSTSRDDGVSGIRLFRIPEGLHWPGDLGGGIEVIQYRHRYVVAPPSLHPEGRAYRWITPDGATSATAVPHVDELPWLPDTWIQGLTHGEAERTIDTVDLGDDEALIWLGSRPAGSTCRAVDRALAGYLDQLRAGQRARHEIALSGTARLAHLAAEGHSGIVEAVATLREAFLAASTAPGSGQREHREAAAEWGRLITGAVRIAAASPAEDDDPCDNPFSGLVDLSSPATVSLEAPATSSAAEQPTDDEGHERTSWWPRDLAGVMSGVDTEPAPSFLVRSDGACMFYAGKVNGLIGESESGKTWVALMAVIEALAAGLVVVYLDFEDTAAGIITRLRGMGATDEHLANLRYVAPDEGLHVGAAADLAELLATASPALIVLDGFNAAMTVLGLDLNSNTDATRFAQDLLKPLSRSGAAVVYVDHVPKAKDQRGKGGIGAQAKRAMTTGCALIVEVTKPFGRGQTGKLRLTVDKDRPGHVRAAALGSHYVGTVELVSDPDSGDITTQFPAPVEHTDEERATFRPTLLMSKVSHLLAGLPDGASQRTIEAEVKGKAAYVRQALTVLVDEGYIEKRAGYHGRGFVYVHVKAYYEALDLIDGGDGE
jgi:hypothetical protein